MRNRKNYIQREHHKCCFVDHFYLLSLNGQNWLKIARSGQFSEPPSTHLPGDPENRQNALKNPAKAFIYDGGELGVQYGDEPTGPFHIVFISSEGASPFSQTVKNRLNVLPAPEEVVSLRQYETIFVFPPQSGHIFGPCVPLTSNSHLLIFLSPQFEWPKLAQNSPIWAISKATRYGSIGSLGNTPECA
jgi:hypothetical protein